MLRLFRLLAPLRPPEGWGTFLLAWAAVLCLHGAAIQGDLIQGVESAAWPATVGLVVAWWLGSRRLRGFVALLTLAALGVLAGLLWGVRVLSPWPLLPQAARWLGWAAGCRLQTDCAVPAPPVTYFADQAAALAGYAGRVTAWVDGIRLGAGSYDNLVLLGLTVLVAWAAAAWAGWWFARPGKAFAALLPSGLLLVLVVYFNARGQVWLVAFLGLAVLLMSALQWHRLCRDWDLSRTDYSPELAFDMAWSTLVVAGLVALAAPTIPAFNPRAISDAFWRTFRQPYVQVEQQMERTFPGIQARRPLPPPEGPLEEGLPRAHLLGGRPELGQQIALRASVRGLEPGDALRWRGQTFDYYDGRAWEAKGLPGGSQDDRQPLDWRSLAAGEPWTDETIPSRHPVLAFVEPLHASTAILYTAGEPVSVDVPYQALTRGPGDLVALRAGGRARRYTVLGAVVRPDAGLLRAAGTRYPPGLLQVYLQLPADLPPEVRGLAQGTAGDAPTPYDAALAIETSLRKLPYSLDVPSPPKGREVVSWFLSDLRRGYCDYFATAMVVLARAAGVPARLAVGYAPGEYDPAAGVYVVTELQAHSWPELYFPGYGWVPFEPTPAQAPPERTDTGVPAADPGAGRWQGGFEALRALSIEQAAAARRDDRFGAFVALLNGLVAALALLQWAVIRRPAPADGPGELYERLAAWGARLGRPLRPAETPREYARALAQTAGQVATGARFAREDARNAAAIVARDVARLAESFEEARFGPAPTDAAVAPGIGDSWRPLWNALRRVWRARRLGW